MTDRRSFLSTITAGAAGVAVSPAFSQETKSILDFCRDLSENGFKYQIITDKAMVIFSRSHQTDEIMKIGEPYDIHVIILPDDFTMKIDSKEKTIYIRSNSPLRLTSLNEYHKAMEYSQSFLKGWKVCITSDIDFHAPLR